jgi:zinc transport system permease protein
VGNIDQITFLETLAVLILSVIVLFLTRLSYRKIIMLNINEDLALTENVNINLHNLLYLFCIAIAISLSVYLVGGFITVALFAIPAAVAKNMSRNLFEYKLLAIISGVFSAVTGIFIACFLGLPIGPIIIIVNVVLFLISVFFKKFRL